MRRWRGLLLAAWVAGVVGPQLPAGVDLGYDGDRILRVPRPPVPQNIFPLGEQQARFERMVTGDPRCPTAGNTTRPPANITWLIPAQVPRPKVPRPRLRMLRRANVALAPPTLSTETESMNREWRQVHEGLRGHPFVNLTVLPLDAPLAVVQRFDWLVLLTPYHVSLVNYSWLDATMTRRTIVIDFQDNRVCSHHNQWYDVPPYRALVYFKRAYVFRKVGVSTNISHFCPLNVAPMHYAIFDPWLLPRTIPWEARPYAVVCTLRARSLNISTGSAGRWNTVQWLKEFQAETSYSMLIKSVSPFGDQCVDTAYLRLLRHARIIVTCQPAHWETDFRTWEALASGALVFVDRMLTPLAYPLQDGVHWVIFDPFNKTDFHRKLQYYLTHPLEARAVARAGHQHALRYHRTVSRMDHVLWTALANKTRTMDLGRLTVRRTHPKVHSHGR
eukprot:EG_transcript_8563